MKTKKILQFVLILLLTSIFFSIIQAQSGDGNLALGKPTTTSSLEVAGRFLSEQAVDGNSSTRWSSQYADPQWIQIDLGATYNIDRVLLNWETAYGKSYRIELSDDGASWTSIYRTSSSNGRVDDLTGLSGTGRYIRMFGTERGTRWGYSLWEFAVYGTPVSTSQPTQPSGLAVYEPWDVNVSNNASITGRGGNSSFGFSQSGWDISNGNMTYDSAGLSYTDSAGNVLNSIAGAVSISSISAEAKLTQRLQTALDSRPQRYFVSYLLRLDSAGAGDAFWTSDGFWDKGGAGLQGSSTLRFVNSSSSGINAQRGSTYFIVVEIDRNRNSAQDSARLWVNPTLTGTGATPNAQFNANGSEGNAIRDAASAIFKFNSANNGAYTIDELRIGDSFDAVTPSGSQTSPPPVVITEPNYPAHCQQSLQNWQSYPDKVDFMVVTTHADDEGIFFGGALPYYTQVRNKKTILIGMTGEESNHAGFNRREELERAAWHYGVQYKPINFGYPDANSNVANAWDADRGINGVIDRLATEIRRYKPDVLLTHAFNGEYGHEAHKLTADAFAQAYVVAADSRVNLEGLPTWQAKKIYIHLHNSPGGNETQPAELVSSNGFMYHSWEEKFPELGGQSSREVAFKGLECHQDAVVAFGTVPVSSRFVTGELFDGHHSEDWGLYRSEVGRDQVPNDFFQNIRE